MSKINQIIMDTALKLCAEYNAPFNMMTYDGIGIEAAIEKDVIQADVVFAMQHYAFSLGYYINDYLAIKVNISENNDIYVVFDADECTDTQLKTVEDYYQHHFRTKQPCYKQMTDFLLFAAIKSTLFIGKSHLDIKAAYNKSLVELNEDIVVINHLRTNLHSVLRPNKQWHINLNNQHDVAVETSQEQTFQSMEVENDSSPHL